MVAHAVVAHAVVAHAVVVLFGSTFFAIFAFLTSHVDPGKSRMLWIGDIVDHNDARLLQSDKGVRATIDCADCHGFRLGTLFATHLVHLVLVAIAGIKISRPSRSNCFFNLIATVED